VNVRFVSVGEYHRVGGVPSSLDSNSLANKTKHKNKNKKKTCASLIYKRIASVATFLTHNANGR
jgi:hypothetical protein